MLCSNTGVFLYVNDGLGGFTRQVISSGPAYYGVDLLALDKNEDRKILATNITSDLVEIWSVVNGAPALDATIGGFANNPWDFAIGDFDGDGDEDVAVGSRDGGSRVSVVLNNNGSLAAPQVINAADWIEDIDAADMDGDGSIDIVAALTNTSRSFQVFLNDGAGTFTAESPTFTGLSVNAVAVGDFGRGSAPDVAVSTRSNPFSLSLYYNQTATDLPGSFDLATPADASSGLALPEAFQGWTGTQAPRFDWASATGFEVTYSIVIATDPALADVVYTASGLTESAADAPLGVLEADTTYYWQATAINPAGDTIAANGPFSFTTSRILLGCNATDQAPPFGVLDLSDVSLFIDGFLSGCP